MTEATTLIAMNATLLIIAVSTVAATLRGAGCDIQMPAFMSKLAGNAV